METFLRDLRYTLRSLRASPGFTLVAVLALALGIGANSAVFSVVNGVLLTSPPFEEPDRLLHLSNDIQKANLEGISVSYPEYQDFTTLPRVFDSVAAFSWRDMTLTGGAAAQRFGVVHGTSSIFSTLGMTPVLGRGFTAEEATAGAQKVVVLTHKAWRTVFLEDPQVLGKSLQLDGEPYTVVGVLPRGVAYPESTELYVPLVLKPEDATKRTSRSLTALARMKPGVTLEQARADVTRVAGEMAAQEPRYNGIGWSIRITPLEDTVVGDVRGTLWLLLGAVGFVLLVACSSVANLMLARAAAREREVSIRAALGASRGRLVAQFLTESLVLSVVGGGLGLLFALWGTDALLAFVGDGLPRVSQVRLDPTSVVFTVGVSLLTGLVFGLVPALQASRADLNATMREGSRGTEGGRSGRLRSGLVVAQVALALVLLVGAGLVMKSLLALHEVDEGFTPEGVLAGRFALPSARYAEPARKLAFERELLERLKTLPGVESAGLTNLLPLGGITTRGLEFESRPETPGEVMPAVDFRVASPDYLRTLKAKLLQGRLHETIGELDAPAEVVINKTFADVYWPQGNALGQRISLEPERRWSTVVGIVDDLREWGLSSPARPAAYWSLAAAPGSFRGLVVRVKSGTPESVRSAVEAELRAVDADLPLYGVTSLSKVVDESIGSRSLLAWLMGLFAGTALLLAALGIAGVVGYSVTRRTREMGIRMALGAARSDVLLLVLRQGLKLVGLGVAVGLVMSLGLTRFLGSLLYGVTAYDPWTFVGVAALLSMVALLATWLPARRASRVDPIISLKAE
ncbi:ABC transporter permease [Myxococcus stipitatus DSM 14675]|uniref:ABC transporter permease n=1 Tax=Myxococcus stipitatus (strain DSM 14675 / JCM 12634 / Mx s8) TaxID=1278073 RepID=L7UJ60_MYXSD|nr:ABC transporter permease [Myxococcus stipitatus]AGC49011.1 ABC transporter permease [Myxococcus stipitatus DSM 14675]